MDNVFRNSKILSKTPDFLAALEKGKTVAVPGLNCDGAKVSRVRGIDLDGCMPFGGCLTI